VVNIDDDKHTNCGGLLVDLFVDDMRALLLLGGHEAAEPAEGLVADNEDSGHGSQTLVEQNKTWSCPLTMKSPQNTVTS
jgi:hypothetical protein